MRIHIRGLAIWMLFLLVACETEDSFLYDEPEAITIAGLEETYEKVALVDKLIIDPSVGSTVPGASFDYFWGVYDTNPHADSRTLDTIATTKKLEWDVTLPPGGWVLVFKATNTTTGFGRLVYSRLNVSTEFTRGWYVMKHDNTGTDVDLFTTPNGIRPVDLTENIYSMVNGRKLQGKGRSMHLFTHFRTTVSGELANTRVLFFLSEQDASVAPLATMKEVQPLNGLFFQTPDIQAPTVMTGNDMAMFLVNNGQVHTLMAVAPNIGKFGAFQLMNSNNSPYQLAPHVMPHRFSNQLFFDELSSSFVMSPMMGNNLIMVNDHPATHMPARNNNKTCLYLGTRNFMAPVGYGVFHDKTDPDIRIISNIIAPSPASFQLINDTLKASDKAFAGSLFTIFHMDENMMYFAVDNEVWSRNLTNRNEQLQFAASPGEDITFLRHRTYMEAGYAFNYVMIGIHSNGSYKVHMFEKTAGNLHAAPVFTLEGEGMVSDVMYVSPAVGNTTYPYFK